MTTLSHDYPIYSSQSAGKGRVSAGCREYCATSTAAPFMPKRFQGTYRQSAEVVIIRNRFTA